MSKSDLTEERASVAPYAPPAYPAPGPAGGQPAHGRELRPGESGPQGPGQLSLTERAIPAEVSAAWELELLIAGAVTFALFQLPGSLDAALAWVEPRATGTGLFLALCGYVYAKAIVYVLLFAFLLNLVARAYWVGLVGLHSVFPRGVRWDKLGVAVGPYTTEEYKRRLSSLPALIARVDNFASVIFSFAFLIVMTFVLSVVTVGGFGAAAYGISTLLFEGKHIGRVAFAIGAVLTVPMLAAGLVDKYLGPRLDPGGRGARFVRGLVRFNVRLNGTWLFGPIFMTLFTNLNKRTMLPLFYVAMFGVMLLGLGDLFVRLIGVGGGGSAYLPEDMEVGGVETDHYESLRDAGAPTTVPTIQADVITGPYVRLFVPYRAERHDPWLASSCPGAAPLRSTRLHLRSNAVLPRGADSIATRTLGCLARLHAVAVDGTPRPELQFRFYTHPRTGRDGIITYIPTASLAPGMHVIRITPPPRRPGSSNRTPPEPWEIPFWK